MKSVNCILLVCLLGLVAHTEETQEQQVERLIGELQDGDSNVRSNAAYALSSIGEGAVDAVPALIQLLQDKGAERFVRVNVVLALSSIGAGAVDAVPALRQLLQDKDLYVRRIATEALESIGAPDTLEVLNAPQKQKIERLIGELQEQDWDIRNSAAMALGQISMMGTSDAIKAAKDAISALNQALQDENVKVRMSAEQALGRINVSMAQGLLEEGLFAEAIAVYEKLIETHPDDSSYIWQLGDAYRQVGGPKKAIESFERLLEAHPENPDLLSQLVQLYQETNNQQKIAGIRDKLLANFDAADLNTGMLCGQLLTQAGQHQEAKRIYEAIIQKHPTEPYIKQVLISVYRQLGENEKAKAILGEMKTNLNPNDPYDSMAYAQGLLDAGLFAEAIALYEKLIETHPDDSSYIWQLGDAYRQVGGPKKAIESFERLLEAHPENPDLLSQLVQLYQETNNQQKIAGIRDKLLANFDAADLNTGMLCGQLLTQAGQHQEAKRIYEAIIQKHPTEPYIKQVLISVYRQLGENEKAKAILGEMKTNLDPNDPYDSMAYAQGLLHGNWFVKQIYTEAYRNNEKETIDIMAALNITNFKFYFKQWCDITMTFGGTTSEIGLALWKMKDGYLELPSSLGNYKITFSNETTALLEYTEGGYVDQTLPPSSDFFQYIQNYYDVDNEDETRTLFLELERDSYQDHLVR